MARLGPETILLFYKEYEWDRFVKHDRYVKRALRPIYNLIRRDQSVSGFYVWFRTLVESLELCGYKVRVNDHALARRHPDYPVGLAGYPVVLDGWDLPNPAILGPGLYDHPAIRPSLMDDPRFKRYITTCDWVDAVFRAYYGDACVPWFAGIDTETWPDTRGHHKDFDVLVYDKIRWNRDALVPGLLDVATRELDRLGLRYTVVRYGQHRRDVYRELLGRSRSMLFLCEHETQGLAYQEAMASGLPILAWDPGFWMDPQRLRYTEEPIPATSVPYFAPECGERFRGADDFIPALERFVARMDEYTPRAYVKRALRREDSAALYVRHYRAAGG